MDGISKQKSDYTICISHQNKNEVLTEFRNSTSGTVRLDPGSSYLMHGFSGNFSTDYFTRHLQTFQEQITSYFSPPFYTAYVQ